MIDWQSDYCLYSTLAEFQRSNNVEGFCHVFKLCEKLGWHLIEYDIENLEILKSISKDGFTLYDNNEFYIYYNPFMDKKRIKFTIAHEIAHIVLYHHIHVDQDVLMYSRNKKDPWEIQADIFAHNLLLPVYLIEGLTKTYNAEEIAGYFKYSPSMVRTRIAKLEHDIKGFNLVNV